MTRRIFFNQNVREVFQKNLCHAWDSFMDCQRHACCRVQTVAICAENIASAGEIPNMLFMKELCILLSLPAVVNLMPFLLPVHVYVSLWSRGGHQPEHHLQLFPALCYSCANTVLVSTATATCRHLPPAYLECALSGFCLVCCHLLLTWLTPCCFNISVTVYHTSLDSLQ